jgi:hypothetical protein
MKSLRVNVWTKRVSERRRERMEILGRAVYHRSDSSPVNALSSNASFIKAWVQKTVSYWALNDALPDWGSRRLESFWSDHEYFMSSTSSRMYQISDSRVNPLNRITGFPAKLRHYQLLSAPPGAKFRRENKIQITTPTRHSNEWNTILSLTMILIWW